MDKWNTDTYDWELFAWAIDFVRCVEEFPIWRKWLLRFVLGKYASREYVGLRERLEENAENQTQFGYGLEDCNYHFDKWNWIYHA